MKTLLMILDGWGIGAKRKSNAIYSTSTPHWDKILKTYPNSQLQASGENVGLPDGQMGNSEVGHLNIGAGRVVYQDLVKINNAIKDGSIRKNKEVISAFSTAQQQGKKLHIMGLTSNGGVHSSLEHLFALLDIAKEYGLEGKTFVHCFMDGRDTDPRSGIGFIDRLEQHMVRSCGEIASIQGRFYAMDRDHRWERIEKAYNCLVGGQGNEFESMHEAMQTSYDKGVTDEFILPVVHTRNGRPVATIKDGDVVIFFNYRNDRAREITEVLTQHDQADFGMKIIPNLHYYCMTPYESSYKGLHILFPKEDVTNTLGEIVSKQGMRQLRIAETEKFAHVTFFFSGGRDKPFDKEDRILIPSPKVPTYDLQPEMSAPEVTAALTEALDKKVYDCVILNFANGDMVGHTGKYNAIQQAVVTIDICVDNVVRSAQKNGYEVIIIADHGNADYAINQDGTPNTAHSLNPVPFVYIPSPKNHKNEVDAKVENGILADVAPTICHLLGINQPEDMTGHNLITVKRDRKRTVIEKR
ncbi:MAG: 2,3-bisphosphoglycerate-independent phosphoglycerate mutase [Paludibacteraceae bacterium]|nr:2,3-bisphosphoglycerate-independent phosphoglycerate mutase [Paludibacteraceae bacterium]